ncbi:MAG: hypothetical protein IKA79_01230 [Lentisphaeria bacterium]|nr:hypothetical protein [Lentisphaeria bacterium]
MPETKKNNAVLDFKCLEENCKGVVKFNLNELDVEDCQVLCPECHRPYEFDAALTDKFRKLANLVAALRDAEPILGSANVAVTVPGGEVKVPYVLLLTRLNTMITLDFGEKKVDFHVLVEPSSPEVFR